MFHDECLPASRCAYSGQLDKEMHQEHCTRIEHTHTITLCLRTAFEVHTKRYPVLIGAHSIELLIARVVNLSASVPHDAFRRIRWADQQNSATQHNATKNQLKTNKANTLHIAMLALSLARPQRRHQHCHFAIGISRKQTSVRAGRSSFPCCRVRRPTRVMRSVCVSVRCT